MPHVLHLAMWVFHHLCNVLLGLAEGHLVLWALKRLAAAWERLTICVSSAAFQWAFRIMFPDEVMRALQCFVMAALTIGFLAGVTILFRRGSQTPALTC